MMNKKIILLFFLILIVQQINADDSLITKNSSWNYYADVDYPDPLWMTSLYDDSSWLSGVGPLGYGEATINTTVPFGPDHLNKYITTLFRHEFTVSSASLTDGAIKLLANYDDGFVAYLNGSEIARRSLPVGTITSATLASSHESGSYEEIDITGFKNLFNDGNNLLAIEVHQRDGNSSDLYWDGALVYSNNLVSFLWSGAVTYNSVKVNARIIPDSTEAFLLVSQLPDLSSPIRSSPDTSLLDINDKVVSFEVSGLIPVQQYYYGLEFNGQADLNMVGRFRTFPKDSGSFMFGLGSCNWTGSNHVVFDTLRLRDPLFFFHMGDMHYENIGVNNVDIFRNAFKTTLGSPRQSLFYQNIPLAYIWDDHDYGPNNSDSTAPGRLAARLTYQEYVPHYPLVEGSGDVAIYQAFTVGRVRFIVCDSRSARSPWGDTDDQNKTMLGTTQKAWFKQELLDARDKYPLIVWVNSLPWIGVTGDDGWYVYTNERKEIANFIAVNNISNLCMISGDAHMIAIDDGTNSDYSDSGNAAFPVFHAASLDRSPSPKGGPYSHGEFPGVGQYGIFTVNDGFDSIRVHWSGMHYLTGELTSYSFAYPVSVATSVDDEVQNLLLPDNLVLEDNYPNPFNGSTVIPFSLANKSKVKLTIYNTLGKIVYATSEKEYSAGTHKIEWRGTGFNNNDLASGVYFYRLTSNRDSKTKKLIFLK